MLGDLTWSSLRTGRHVLDRLGHRLVSVAAVQAVGGGPGALFIALIAPAAISGLRDASYLLWGLTDWYYRSEVGI